MHRFFPTLASVCLFQLMSCAATTILAQQSSAINNQQPTVIIGVLEDLPGLYFGDPNFRAVRVIFRKTGGEWMAFPTESKDQQSLRTLTKSYPKEVNWTIAFDGRRLGHIISRAPDDFAWYAGIGLEKIYNSDPIPTVGQQSVEYAGWNGKPVFRPLVAISEPNFRDPDRWQRAQLTSEEIVALRLAFRNEFPDVSNCRNPEENLEKPWRYRDDEIGMGTTYLSARHWRLAELHLRGYACDGPIDDGGPFDSQWYAIDPAGEVRHIGSGMWLADSGDYDNDGKSEVLFTVSGYAEGGYRLFYADFSKSAEFLFSYN